MAPGDARARIARLLSALGLLLIALSIASSACSREVPSAALGGVRLGMTPRDVRDRFDGGGAGAWQTKVATVRDDTVLEWTATGEGSRATRARFEFHLGMMVAIRAHLREPIGGERVDVTPRTVTVRAPAAGGSDVTILARDCPTHHDEAESIVVKAR